MTWLPTIDGGAVNSQFVIRIKRTDDGSDLHLTTGEIVKSPLTFTVDDGKLVEVEPIDDDDDQAIPFD